MLPDPLKSADYFGVNSLVKIKDMFDAKVHLGHMDGSLHPAMRNYLYGSRLGHCVFDLDLTASMLRRSLHVSITNNMILIMEMISSHSVTKSRFYPMWSTEMELFYSLLHLTVEWLLE